MHFAEPVTTAVTTKDYHQGNLTPMMRQYFDVKAERPDIVLLMRVGDFYEAYGEDAELLSRELEITLTGRDDKLAGMRIPMAGVPYHALERYAARLIGKGFKVAICDQVEDPKQAKGLVKRRVTRVITPGTVVEDSMLDAKSNNYLVAAVTGETIPSGVGIVDVSTGEFLVTELPKSTTTDSVLDEIIRLQPTECLLFPGMDELADAIRSVTRATVTFHASSDIRQTSRQALLRHFGTQSLIGFGCDNMTSGLDAAALVLDYVKQTQLSAVSHIQSLSTYSTDQFMTLDSAARRNLELTHSISDGAKSKSLVSLLDKTVTPMGARMFRGWFDHPLLDLAMIRNRQDGVAALLSSSIVRGDLRECLRQIADLERLMSRTCNGMANARDLVALRRSLEIVPQILAIVRDFSSVSILADCASVIENVPEELCALLNRALMDDPPLMLRDGGLIKVGYNHTLDDLRELRSGGKARISEMEDAERARTGIRNLKIGFNNVFGYYIELPKSAADELPEDYHRKQTTANTERYVTPALKEYELLVLGAHDKIVDLEYQLFGEVRDIVAKRHSGSVLKLAQSIAKLDVIAGLAETALQHRFFRPDVHDGETLSITAGRHPVVESLQSGTSFVPNDTHLDTDASRLHIITGPNSAGKSTYLRQVALIVLLAQIGSYVPADTASVGLVNRIFTRVGAHDDLANGQSTFMVEMSETANILNNATSRSLVILDEVGRGTSTFDGLALAWSVAEHLHEIGAKTLFATHYHHLNDLESRLAGAKNFRVAVKEKGDHIVWMRRIMPGGTDKSYGIQVAKLAGVPDAVLVRARQVLVALESSSKPDKGNTRADFEQLLNQQTKRLQLTLFETEPNPLIEELRTLDLGTLSPIEALNVLYRLQKLAIKPQ